MIQQILRFLQQLESRQLYFWTGFLAGALFWWIFTKLRTLLPQFRDSLRKSIQEARRSLSTSTESRLRNDIYRQAQRMHLAAPLFALDEIVISPRLMAPPASPLVEEEGSGRSIDAILPYLPDWPELAATYHGPVFSLPEALSGGANLILVGAPGSGKTVALAHLAIMMTRQGTEIGELAEKLPLLVHAADFVFPSEPPKELLQPLIDALALNVSPLTLPRLTSLIRATFERGSALLLLDGLDEMPPSSIHPISAFLGTVLKKYPQARMVVAASPEYYDGLIALGMIPVAMAAWNELERANFIRHWGDMWHRYITPLLPEEKDQVDPLLLNGWLLSPDASITPLELMLKAWAAYAGDVHGSGASDSIESFLLRMTVGIPKARPILEKMASQIIISASPIIGVREIQKLAPESSPSVSPFDESAPPFTEEQLVEEETLSSEETGAGSPLVQDKPVDKDTSAARGKKSPSPLKPGVQGTFTIQQRIPGLVEAGILVARRDGRVIFSHPVLAGYLAGTALASSGDVEKVSSQPEWTMKALAMRYLSHWNDLTEFAQPMLEDKSDPLFRKLIIVCRWLRDSSVTARWRSLSMRHLAGLLQKELLPVSLRVRALTALIYSGDPGVSVLLRSLLANHMESVRRLAALGCGLARDAKAVKDLINLIHDPAISVSQAAMLALVAIGNRQALDSVATELLQGTEELRRAAAEALANNPEEGHPALADGSSMPDLLVRRAVVYGLVRVRQPWALQLLEKMQVEDEQWVVRSAATQALEEIHKPDPRLPRPLPPMHQLPWLIMYAGKQGIGVTPGKPALDLAISALRSQEPKEQFAAMFTLSFLGEGSFAHHLYLLLYGGEAELQDAAYNSLWQIAASGIELPPPTQYGFVF